MARVFALDSRRILLDVAAIVAVAVLLVGIHWFVPPGVREALTLRYDRPDPLHAFTAAFVHLTDAHLVGNVAGYLVGGAFVYLLTLLADERRWFHFSFLWFLTVLPIAVGMTAALVIDRAVVGRGFSGVVAGFAGFALVGAGVVLHRVFGYDRGLASNLVGALTLVVAAEILWVMTGVLPPLLGGVLVVGVGIMVVPFGQRAIRSGFPADRAGWIRLAGAVAVVGIVLAFVTVFVIALFPSRLVNDGGVTNVLAHYLGLVYGAVIAAWGYRYWSDDA